MSDLLHAEWQEVLLLEDVGGAAAEQLEHDADVTAMLEPVQHPHTGAVRRESACPPTEDVTEPSAAAALTICCHRPGC